MDEAATTKGNLPQGVMASSNNPPPPLSPLPPPGGLQQQHAVHVPDGCLLSWHLTDDHKRYLSQKQI